MYLEQTAAHRRDFSVLKCSSKFGAAWKSGPEAPLGLHLALASLLIIANVVTHLYQQFLSFPARRQHFSGEAQDKHGKRQRVRASQVSQQKRPHCFSCSRKPRESHTTSASQPAVKVMGFGKQTKLGSDRESLVSSSVNGGLFCPCLTDSCSED